MKQRAIPREVVGVEYSLESGVVRVHYREGAKETLLLATSELPLDKVSAAARKQLDTAVATLAKDAKAKVHTPVKDR